MVKKADESNIKFGFSLAEALVSMLVLSLFFIATAKIITVKQKDKPKIVAGYYECALVGSERVENGTTEKNASGCAYNPPPRSVNNIYICSVLSNNIRCTSEPAGIDAKLDLPMTFRPEELSLTFNGTKTVDTFCKELVAIGRQSAIMEACEAGADGTFNAIKANAWYVYW